MAKQLIIRFTLSDDENVALHKAQNFSEALMLALQRRGLGTTSDPDHVTDGLRIELASPRDLGAVRRLLQQMLKKHYLVEQSVISEE
jgi:protein required for attachment to host cells